MYIFLGILAEFTTSKLMCSNLRQQLLYLHEIYFHKQVKPLLGRAASNFFFSATLFMHLNIALNGKK